MVPSIKWKCEVLLRVVISFAEYSQIESFKSGLTLVVTYEVFIDIVQQLLHVYGFARQCFNPLPSFSCSFGSHGISY